MYFENFPVIPYDSSGELKFKAVTNLLRRVALRSNVRAQTLLFDTYEVKEGETPEMIAGKLYDDPELHWIILMINNVTDRYHQWPMTVPQFLEFINDKYDNPNGIHHYEISQTSGDSTLKIDIGPSNADYPTATAVTNLEYEQAEQDKKRKIILIDPVYVPQIVDEFQALMNESKI